MENTGSYSMLWLDGTAFMFHVVLYYSVEYALPSDVVRLTKHGQVDRSLENPLNEVDNIPLALPCLL